MPIPNSIAVLAEDLRTWRRDIHRHPELGYEETRTAAFVAQQLRDFGCDVVETGLARTGVVATIRGRGAARGEAHAILLRADMDALPLTEESGAEHASTIPGKMHACGHDGHTAMLLMAARRLCETRNFDGEVHLCFQPAEEGGAGARLMIEQGLFERFPCREVYAMHNWPGAPVGHFLSAGGPIFAATGEFEITLNGGGGHAAKPHETRDPIVAGAALVSALQSVVARRVDPLAAAVLTVTQFHAGTAWNIIPTEATLRGTIRTFDSAVHETAFEELNRMTAQIAAAYGLTAHVERLGSFYPPTVNDPEATDFALAAARAVAGDANVHAGEGRSMGGEDFSFMTQQKPGCMILMGNGENSPPLHSASYDFNDEGGVWGVAYWCALVERALPLRRE